MVCSDAEGAGARARQPSRLRRLRSPIRWWRSQPTPEADLQKYLDAQPPGNELARRAPQGANVVSVLQGTRVPGQRAPTKPAVRAVDDHADAGRGKALNLSVYTLYENAADRIWVRVTTRAGSMNSAPEQSLGGVTDDSRPISFAFFMFSAAPVLKQRFLEGARARAHRQDRAPAQLAGDSPRAPPGNHEHPRLPVFRYIDVNDPKRCCGPLTSPIRRCRWTSFCTPRRSGALLHADRPRHSKHRGKVTAVVPHYSMSDGSLIALCG